MVIAFRPSNLDPLLLVDREQVSGVGALVVAVGDAATVRATPPCGCLPSRQPHTLAQRVSPIYSALTAGPLQGVASGRLVLTDDFVHLPAARMPEVQERALERHSLPPLFTWRCSDGNLTP
jgi:hypothetical protein